MIILGENTFTESSLFEEKKGFHTADMSQFFHCFKESSFSYSTLSRKNNHTSVVLYQISFINFTNPSMTISK